MFKLDEVGVIKWHSAGAKAPVLNLNRVKSRLEYLIMSQK